MTTIITPGDPSQTIEQSQQDVKSELPDSNPWLESGLLRALTVGLGRRAYDLYEAIEKGNKLAFPFDAAASTSVSTIISKFLQFWATLKNMQPNTAQKATGPITITGTVGNSAPADSVWKVGTTEYTLDSSVTIQAQTRNVVSLSVSGTVATCTTTEDHNLRDGMDITISDATQSEWNTTWSDVTVTGSQSFQFTVPITTPTPATGTPVVSFDAAFGALTSSDTGAFNNQTNGVAVESSQTYTGIDSTAGTQYTGITGGLDDETASEYAARIIYRWQNPETPFNAAKIISTVKGVGGGKNTRVWVRRVRPVVGAVSIYFVRDDDESIMPDASEIAEAKAAVVAISSPQTEESDIHVNDTFTGVTVDTVISNVIPNTTTMKASLKARVRTFYRGGGLMGGLEEGQNVDVEQFKSDLYQTRDYQTGERIQSFTMTSPPVDVEIADGEIAIEGNTTVG